MARKETTKPFILRLDAKTMEAVEKWADDEFRSTNGQLQWIITEALRKSRRLPKKTKEEKDIDTKYHGNNKKQPALCDYFRARSRITEHQGRRRERISMAGRRPILGPALSYSFPYCGQFVERALHY